MPRKVVAGLILACLFSTGVLAGWKDARESLDQSYNFGNFRIFYTLKGSNAFPGEATESERAVLAPRYLDALADQLARADEHFRSVLGLRPPLSNLRYRGATSIDIHILRLDGKSGSTGDEIHVFRYKHFQSSPAALTIALSNRWQPGNNTPAHELFHAYQYGYTLVKTAWFLEGMARSNESLTSIPGDKRAALPKNVEELGQVLRRSYGAAPLWNRIAEHCGVTIFGDILAAFQRIDPEIARARGLKPMAWPEEEQRSTRNTPYLLRGLSNVLDEHCARKGGRELDEFKVMLRAMGAGTVEATVSTPASAPR